MLSTKYMFQSEPQAVQPFRAGSVRSKYRDPFAGPPPAFENVMFNQRVIRGNTHAVLIPTTNQLRELERIEAQEAFKTQTMRMRTQIENDRIRQEAIYALEAPVAGRVHKAAQCDDYLLGDNIDPDTIGNGLLPRFTAEATTQADTLEHGNDVPLIIWHKDPAQQNHKATQIEDGELFDYNAALSVLVDVLVGKSLDVGIVEVRQEQEVKALLTQKEWFINKRQKQLHERRQDEERTKQRQKANDALLAEARVKLEEQKYVARKVAAGAVSRQFLANLQSNVFASLEAQGKLVDPMITEVEQVFMPWLLKQVDERLGQARWVHFLIDEITKEQVEHIHFTVAEKARLEEEARENEARLLAELRVLQEAERVAQLAAAASQAQAAAEAEASRIEKERLAAEAAEKSGASSGDEDDEAAAGEASQDDDNDV